MQVQILSHRLARLRKHITAVSGGLDPRLFQTELKRNRINSVYSMIFIGYSNFLSAGIEPSVTKYLGRIRWETLDNPPVPR